MGRRDKWDLFYISAIRFFFVFVFVLGIAGCNLVNVQPGSEPLPVVEALALPQLPNWIEEISPTGQVETLAQIRIRFKDALIPIEELDSEKQQKLLQKFEILPPLPGQFRFLTPRMVGFQSDRAIPKATRVKVTLKAGLGDLNNHQLEKDLAWTFNTEKIQLTNLPGKIDESELTPEPIDIKPTFEVTSNVKLDLASLQDKVKLIGENSSAEIDFEVALKEDKIETNYRQPQENFDPSLRSWNYSLTPRKTLAKATNYRLEFSSGLHPANGNLESDRAFISQVKTYSPLAFEKIQPYGQPNAGGTYGRFLKGSPQLYFNNRLVAESAIENIQVKPIPKNQIKLVRVYEGDNYVDLNPWSLEPNTNYTITINKNLKDQFGQTLDKPITLTYNTGDIAPDLWMPTGLNIFPASTNLQLNISTINLPDSNYQAAYQIVEPKDLVYIDSAYPSGDGGDILPNASQWSSFPIRSLKNQTHEVAIPLREKLGGKTGMLAYGVKAKTNSYLENAKTLQREPDFYGLVQLTNLGVFAQWFSDSSVIRVNHLSDGSAVINAPVEIYQSKLGEKRRGIPQPCAIAQTDGTGMAIIEGSDWQQCLTDKKAPELLVIAKEDKDWAFARTNEYSGSYEYGIYVGWDDGTLQSRGTIFSDRQLYQPGEKGEFTGVAYYLQDGLLKQDKNTPYQVTVRDPNGKETSLGTYNTNNFGTFSVELTLDKTQPLGYYSIRAKGKSGAEIYGDFRVAEFKPPNFKVDLKLDKEVAFIDQKVSTTVNSNYLFGAPLQEGKINYYVTRQKTYFAPKNWDKFSFGRQWFWPEESPEVPTDVRQATATLNESGENTQEILVTQDLPYPMTYRVEAQVSDVSNLSVSNVQTFTALPSDRLIGLQHDFVADANKPFSVEVVVTDPDGKAISGESVRVELQQMEYSSVTQLQEGTPTSKNQVQYKTVAEEKTRSGNEPQTVTFTPKESGSYRIQANFSNSKSDVAATDSQLWVTGNEAVSWGDRYDNNRLDIKLDKESYKPGEIATALIQSPYPEAEVYFAVIRNKTLYSAIEKVTGGAPKIQFQVTPDMVPNAAVEAVLVRQGKPLEEIEPANVENLVMIGFAPFSTNLDDKYLQVRVTPQAEKREPGTPQTIDLSLKDSGGNPVEGQFTVMAVNESILQLSGYRLPDLVETVYSTQDITTRLADNRPDVVLQTQASPLQKGWGYGGGASTGSASTRVRTDFQPLAYYNGSVLTDEKGQASITFPLPDDLTTWRVMAVATDGNFHFGNGDATFIATQPLITNPVLPQFVRVGDRFLGGVTVTNTTETRGNLAIAGSTSDNLGFSEKSSVQTQSASGTQAYRLPMTASQVGEGKVKFTTQLNNQLGDAFEVPLEVKSQEVSEQVIESGVTTSEVKIPLEISRKVVPNVGGLDISLASTLIPEITASAKQVFTQEELPFLEPAATQLAIAANLESLAQSYTLNLSDINPSQKATQAIETLKKLQQADGGFAYLPKDESTKSDPFLSPYAAESIAQAKLAGFAIDDVIVTSLQRYLNNILLNPSQYDFCKTDSCKNQIRLESLIALAALGEKRTDFLLSLYEQRNLLDRVDQIKLARYLWQFPQWQEQARVLSEELQEIIYETGRSATVNLPESYSWLNSTATVQAQALRLLIAQNSQPEQRDRVLKGLLDLRREGTWQNTYDNAQALTALVEYAKIQPQPPSYRATVQLDRKVLGKAQFQGYRNPSLEINVPMRDLPKGRHDLILNKFGRGDLHYLTAYRYRLEGNQPGRFNGLRVTRTIRPANQTTVLGKQSLYAPDKPLTLPAGQIFDIGLEIISDHPINHIVINDPLPAGFEAVDTSFQTETAYFQPQQDSWQIGYQTIYRDKVVAYGDRLDAGVYNLHYLVRSVTPGNFDYPGAEVHLQYAPEEFGRTASSRLEISP